MLQAFLPANPDFHGKGAIPGKLFPPKNRDEVKNSPLRLLFNPLKLIKSLNWLPFGKGDGHNPKNLSLGGFGGSGLSQVLLPTAFPGENLEFHPEFHRIPSSFQPPSDENEEFPSPGTPGKEGSQQDGTSA